jgi:hypothetical protein
MNEITTTPASRRGRGHRPRRLRRLMIGMAGTVSAMVATSANPFSTVWNTRYLHDVPTAPIHCGGIAAWYTYSWVSIDGSAWQSFKGPEAFWAPSC